MADKYTFNQKSESVKDLQRALRECLDHTLVVDGHFGNNTLTALKGYQSALNLEVTGLYSGKTQVVLDEYIARRFLSPESYALAANALGVSEPFITAVANSIANVESRGYGFLPDGQLVLLFERHKFRFYFKEYLQTSIGVRNSYANQFNINVSKLSAADTITALLEKADALYPSICSSKPGGYLVGSAELARHRLAVQLCSYAAYNSASYGKWQIMGFHAKICGYTSAEQMYLELSKSESNHLKALVMFFRANEGMLRALARKDYAGFSKLYNGANYAINKYDTKLAAELKKFGW